MTTPTRTGHSLIHWGIHCKATTPNALVLLLLLELIMPVVAIFVHIRKNFKTTKKSVGAVNRRKTDATVIEMTTMNDQQHVRQKTKDWKTQTSRKSTGINWLTDWKYAMSNKYSRQEYKLWLRLPQVKGGGVLNIASPTTSNSRSCWQFSCTCN